MAKTKNEKAAARKRTLQNSIYALKWLYKIDKFYVIYTVLCAIISEVVAMVEHSFLVAYIIDCIENQRPFTDVLLFWGPVTAVVVFNMVLFNYFTSGVIPKKVEKVDREMRLTLYEKAAQMDMARYDDPQFYNDFVWAMKDSPGHVHGVLHTFSSLCSTIALVLCMGAFMIVADAAGLLFVVASLVISMVMRFKLNKRFMRMHEEMRPDQRRRDYVNRVFYLADYAKDLRMGEMKEPLYKDFEQSTERLTKTTKKHSRFLWRFAFAQDFIRNTLSFDGLYLTYLLFRTLVLHAFGYGTMVALYNISSRLRGNLQAFSYILPRFQEHGLYIEKIRHFLETENILPDTGKEPLPQGGELTLSHVDFTYPGADAPTLHDISMTIPKGAKIALVGYNGAGKSTLVKLLMRLYDPTKGEICYGGKPLPQYSLEGYRERVGTLFQDHQMVAALLSENVTMSPDEPDGERLRDALQRAALDDLLQRLPQGADTPLTKEFEDSGVNLSGGEAQKVAIARVLYSNADILILDEPSSALDPLSEYRLNQTMRKLAGDKTVIFISHRLSTTRIADHIYMLENGRITEHGSHDELMAKGGSYANMFLLQAQKYR